MTIPAGHDRLPENRISAGGQEPSGPAAAEIQPDGNGDVARLVSAVELERLKKELEALSYSVSHDLRGPLRAIDGFGRALFEDHASQLDARGLHYLERVRAATHRMSELIDGLLNLSRITRTTLERQAVDLTAMAARVVAELRRRDPFRAVTLQIADGLTASADSRLVRLLLDKLLGNAWKFTAGRDDARISFGLELTTSGPTFFVRDNGAGFDMTYADKLFAPFRRLHHSSEFEGTGIGLATAERIVSRHGGRISALAAVDAGATFFFTLDTD